MIRISELSVMQYSLMNSNPLGNAARHKPPQQNVNRPSSIRARTAGDNQLATLRVDGTSIPAQSRPPPTNLIPTQKKAQLFSNWPDNHAKASIGARVSEEAEAATDAITTSTDSLTTQSSPSTDSLLSSDLDDETESFTNQLFAIDYDEAISSFQIAQELKELCKNNLQAQGDQFYALDIILHNCGMRRVGDKIRLKSNFSLKRCTLLLTPNGRKQLALVIHNLCSLDNHKLALQLRDALLQISIRYGISPLKLPEISISAERNYWGLRDRVSANSAAAIQVFDNAFAKLPSKPYLDQRNQPISNLRQTGNQFGDYLLGHAPHSNGQWLRDTLRKNSHNAFIPNSEFLNWIFPTDHEAINGLDVSNDSRRMFYVNPYLRAVHRKAADIAMQKFGLIRLKGSRRKITTALNSPSSAFDWLKEENQEQRSTLLQITRSLYLHENQKLAINLQQFAIHLLQRHCPTKTQEFKNVFADIEDIDSVTAIVESRSTPSVDDFDLSTALSATLLETESTTFAKGTTFAQKQLQRLNDEAKTLYEQRLTSFPMPLSTKKEILALTKKGKFSKATKRASETYSSTQSIDKKQRKEAFMKYFITQYESEGWNLLSTKIYAYNGYYFNQLTPFNMLDIDKNGQKHNIFDGVVKKHQGISSFNRNDSPHISNLWHSELFNDQNQELFSGIRHGSLSYQAEKKYDQANKQEKVKNKARELVTAALFSKYKKEIEKIISDPQRSSLPLKLRMTSTSLMTLFNLVIASFKECEENQFYQQRKALEDLQQELKFVCIAGIDIPVELDIILFSTGVNNFSLSTDLLVKRANKNSWRKADQINKQGLGKLLGDINQDAKLGGWVQNYLDELDDNNEENRLEIIKIRTLCDEIKYIFANDLHHNENEDRYSLAKRIIYLTYLIGAVPTFNCKSGKDRTGAVDSEVKALAATLDVQTNTIEKINTKPSKEALCAFHLDIGNFVIQKLNNGLTGNKVMSYGSKYFDSIFTHEQLTLVKGLIDL